MKTLTVHMLPGESPYRAVKRIVKEIEDAYGVDLELVMDSHPDGVVHVTADFYARVVVTQTTEVQWQQIKMDLQAVAERALRGDP